MKQLLTAEAYGVSELESDDIQGAVDTSLLIVPRIRYYGSDYDKPEVQPPGKREGGWEIPVL